MKRVSGQSKAPTGAGGGHENEANSGEVPRAPSNYTTLRTTLQALFNYFICQEAMGGPAAGSAADAAHELLQQLHAAGLVDAHRDAARVSLAKALRLTATAPYLRPADSAALCAVAGEAGQ